MTQLYKIVYRCYHGSTLKQYEEYDLNYPVFDYCGKPEAHKWMQEQARAKMRELGASGDVYPGGEVEWFEHNGIRYSWTITYNDSPTVGLTKKKTTSDRHVAVALSEKDLLTIINKGFDQLVDVSGKNSAGIPYSTILADMQAAWNKLKKTK